jgi:hypothetical protein
MATIIPVFEVLGWLNAFEPSRLGRQAQTLVRRLRDPMRSEDDLDRIITRLQDMAQGSEDPFEAAEILLNCAAVDYWRMQFPRASRGARATVNLYRTDNTQEHRLAVARWILGMAQWEQLNNARAFANWSRARTIFRRRLRNSRAAQDNRARDLYESFLRLMECDLAAKPEQLLVWLNRFEPSRLSASSRRVLDIALPQIRQNRFQAVSVVMTDLQEITNWSNAAEERAEALLESGFAAYQVGSYPLALELLGRAVPAYSPESGVNHKQVMARWMLGAVEWMVSTARNKAILDWTRCIEELEQLRLRSDRDNRQERRKWYADRRITLQNALAEQISASDPARLSSVRRGQPGVGPGPFPAGPPPRDGGPAAPQSPQPEGPTAGPAQNRPDRFQYLCSLIGGNEMAAERLIAREGERSGIENRDELIERVIERIVRDRQ